MAATCEEEPPSHSGIEIIGVLAANPERPGGVNGIDPTSISKRHDQSPYSHTLRCKALLDPVRDVS